MFKFFGSVIDEMKIVTWPTRTQLTKDVLTVIQTTILFGIYFGVVDYVISFLIQLFMKV